MDTRGIEQMLSELRSTAQIASGKALQPKQAGGGGAAEFCPDPKGQPGPGNQGPGGGPEDGGGCWGGSGDTHQAGRTSCPGERK